MLVGVARPDADYSVRLARYGEDIRRDPTHYLKRVERAFLLLEHGATDEPVGEDIDTLLSHAEWRSEGMRLKAIRFHHQKRMKEAEPLLRANIAANIYVEEQSRLLADAALSRKDTAAAIAAYRQAWEQQHDENDYLDLLSLHKGRGKPPEELLQKGLNLYPRSPGVIQTAFEVYFAAGDTSSLGKCLRIAGNAEITLWPFSVDWKVRHARTMLALNRPRDAEPILMTAMDLLDGDPRLQESERGTSERKEILALLDSARQVEGK